MEVKQDGTNYAEQGLGMNCDCGCAPLNVGCPTVNLVCPNINSSCS